MKKLFKILLFLNLIFSFKLAIAAEPVETMTPESVTNPHTIGLDLYSSERTQTTSTISGTFYLPNTWSVSGSYGSSKNKSESDEKTSEAGFAEIFSNRERLFSAGLQYEYWGLDGALTSTTYFLPLEFRFRKWLLGVGFGQGPVLLQAGIYRPREIEIEQDVTKVKLSYSGLDKWTFTLRSENREYDKNFTLLSTTALGDFLSDAALSLSSSLINFRHSLEFSYMITGAHLDFDIGVEFSQSEAAFDESRLSTTALFADLYLNEHWSLALSAGRSRYTDNGLSGQNLEDEDPIGFGSIGVHYEF